jgi:phage/plasmid-like protein (TIGR03299 family)
MAHNIWNDGTTDAMFCVGDRDAAWHKLGQRTQGAVTWMEAMELANLNWTCDLVKMFYRGTLADVQTGRGPVMEVPEQFAVIRSIDNACLGVVGSDYRVIQNRDAFSFVDSILEAEKGAHYESAGALGNGERIWTMARIPGSDFAVGGTDAHESYLLFTTSHDGSGAGVAKLTTTRVVCQNTLQSALSGGGSVMRFRHTKNVQDRLERAKLIMTGVTQDVKQLREKFEFLASKRMTKDSLVAVIDRLFPKSEDEKSSQTRRDGIVAEVLKLYELNDGKNGNKAIAGTGFNLFNAVTEYVDHFRSARITEGRKGMTVQQARAENAVFGTGERLKTEALGVLLDAVKNNPPAFVGGQSQTHRSTSPSSPAAVTSSAVMDAPEIGDDDIQLPEDLQSKVDAEVKRILES